MRSEHTTTGDEFDLRVRQWYKRFDRAGVAKGIKTRSHRHDRRVVKARAICEGRSEAL